MQNKHIVIQEVHIPRAIQKPQENMDVDQQEVDAPLVVPRFANFLETTASAVLIKSASMEEVVKKLSEGTYLWKIRGLTKWYHRHYKIEQESMSLVAESKKWWNPGGLVSVALVDILEIREGFKSDVFNKISDHNEKNEEKLGGKAGEPTFAENRCFSVILGRGMETLDVVASSAEERELWVSGLRHLVEAVLTLHKDRQYDMWLRKKFEAADKDNNKALNFDECLSLLVSLNLQLDKKHAKELFNRANTRKQRGEQVLDAGEFVQFYHSLLKFPEIEKLFKKYADEKTGVMGGKELLQLVHQEQGLSTFELSQAIEMIQNFEQSHLREDQVLSFEGFYNLLLSEHFNVFNCEHQSKVHMDMTRPLSHYYISSSHNTYLTGHQLVGESSLEGYISALKRGCKVVELDLWDGDEGEPIIYHGHTLTTKITLADVLRDAIKPYAFHVSPYPLILSVENNLSIEQQAVMVRQLKEILGEHLMTSSVPSDIKCLLSPEDLKNKIIVKAKKPKGGEVEVDDEEGDDQENIDYIDTDETSKKSKPLKPLAPELREVVNICEGKKFVSFSSSFENDKCVHFPSVNENKGKSLRESSSDNFVKFTEKQIIKIYPLGTRTDSSNLKPYLFWSVGAQVVTLNMQTEDKATFYNNALFKSNGGCGYVLKPDVLLGKMPYNPVQVSDKLKKVLRVRILSGQHLPSSQKKGDIVDPYVQLKVRGHDLDKQKQRTKAVKNNGFNPVWNETLEVHIRVPDISLVYFTVRDESSMAKDSVLALTCVPFRSMTTGYRHVHLTDLAGKSLSPAALFVHVSISDS